MAPMVIEVPEELKDLGVAMIEAMAAVKTALGSATGGKALDHDKVECTIADAVAGSSAPATGRSSRRSTWTARR